MANVAFFAHLIRARIFDMLVGSKRMVMAMAMVMVVLEINTVVNYSRLLAKEKGGVGWGKIHDGRDRA